MSRQSHERHSDHATDGTTWYVTLCSRVTL
jgi:hypothetical protein